MIWNFIQNASGRFRAEINVVSGQAAIVSERILANMQKEGGFTNVHTDITTVEIPVAAPEEGDEARWL